MAQNGQIKGSERPGNRGRFVGFQSNESATHAFSKAREAAAAADFFLEKEKKEKKETQRKIREKKNGEPKPACRTCMRVSYESGSQQKHQRNNKY